MSSVLTTIIQASLSLVITAAAALLFLTLRGAFTRRIPVSGDTDIISVVTVSGQPESLAETINGLLWLNDSGVYKGSVLIVDCGMSDETKKLAGLLTRDKKGVVMCSRCELGLIWEDFGWTEKKST